MITKYNHIHTGTHEQWATYTHKYTHKPMIYIYIYIYNCILINSLTVYKINNHWIPLNKKCTFIT